MSHRIRVIVVLLVALLVQLIIPSASEVLGTGVSAVSVTPDRALQRDFELFQSQSVGTIQADGAKETRKNILVTGGTGYIAVHTIVTLLEEGYDVTVVDNLVNSSPEGLKRAIGIAKVDPYRVRFFQVDLLDYPALEEVFQNSPQFSASIHFAALKAVGESVQKPVLYYENNVHGTLNLLNLMGKYGCRSIIFSSSATVCF